MDLQLSMGFEGVPDTELFQVEHSPVALAPRPGRLWVLLAGKKGPIGFHHLLYTAPYGLCVAVCGAKGRRVAEDCPEIALCPLCAAEGDEGHIQEA